MFITVYNSLQMYVKGGDWLLDFYEGNVFHSLFSLCFSCGRFSNTNVLRERKSQRARAILNFDVL